MNKKIWIITAATVALLGTGSVIAAQTSGIISKSKAKEAALKQVNGVVEEIDLERERGKLVYEIEIERSGKDDDATVIIDAKTGETLAVYDDDDDNMPRAGREAVSSAAASASSANGGGSQGSSGAAGSKSANSQSVSAKPANGTSTAASSNAILTKEQAKKIALDTVKGTIIELDLDRDDGVTKYEVEIKTTEGKVELDIDAYSGKVLSQKLDRDDDWDDDRYDDDDDWDDDWDDDNHDDDDDDWDDDDRYDD